MHRLESIRKSIVDLESLHGIRRLDLRREFNGLLASGGKSKGTKRDSEETIEISDSDEDARPSSWIPAFSAKNAPRPIDETRIASGQLTDRQIHFYLAMHLRQHIPWKKVVVVEGFCRARHPLHRDELPTSLQRMPRLTAVEQTRVEAAWDGKAPCSEIENFLNPHTIAATNQEVMHPPLRRSSELPPNFWPNDNYVLQQHTTRLAMGEWLNTDIITVLLGLFQQLSNRERRNALILQTYFYGKLRESQSKANRQLAKEKSTPMIATSSSSRSIRTTRIGRSPSCDPKSVAWSFTTRCIRI